MLSVCSRSNQVPLGQRHAPRPYLGLALGGILSEELGMTCTVKVANGAILLPPGLNLPDGAEVRLTISETPTEPSFAERYAAYIGIADDLPADLAANLDHYVHGQRA